MSFHVVQDEEWSTLGAEGQLHLLDQLYEAGTDVPPLLVYSAAARDSLMVEELGSGCQAGVSLFVPFNCMDE